MLGKVPTLGGLKSPPSQPRWLTRPKRLVFPAAGSTAYPVTSPLHSCAGPWRSLTIPHPRSVKRQWIEWTSSVKSYRVGGLRTWCLPKPVSFAPVKTPNTSLEACLPVPAQPQKPYFILGNSSTHTKHFLTVLHKHTRVYPFFRIFLSYFVLFCFVLLSQTTS